MQTSVALPPKKLTWTRIVPRAADASTNNNESPIARSSHGVSLLHHPLRLFVYGGEHVARTPIAGEQTCWQVNLEDDLPIWQNIDCTSSNSNKGPPERIAHAQAVCDNVVYIFGGRAGVAMHERAMNDLWSYDDTNGWKELETSGPCPAARSFHRMICVNRALYVYGGCGEQGRMNDLHKLDLATMTWETLPASSLRGRGGSNLLSVNNERQLAVIAGFSGEETRDGQVFDLTNQTWSETLLNDKLQDMRPRSVCVSGSLPSASILVIFGGEVDPSDRGHEGAGGFANDVCLFDEVTGAFLTSASKNADSWPEERGWSAADVVDQGNGKGQLFVFGGLAGDDSAPRRLDDLWRMDIEM